MLVSVGALAEKERSNHVVGMGFPMAVVASLSICTFKFTLADIRSYARR